MVIILSLLWGDIMCLATTVEIIKTYKISIHQCTIRVNLEVAPIQLSIILP
jgi:hypothetical protein